MKNLLFIFLCVSVFALLSCGTQRASVRNYLEKADTSSLSIVNLADPVIQRNDLLSIKVYSLSARPEIDAMYNLSESATGNASMAAATAGFLVDNDGNIEYPRLGSIRAEGLTKNELAKLIKSKLDTILRSPSVIVRFLNYRITVLGEVRAPGTFTVPSERITIIEALGMAGDISDFGNKTSVKIMRENSGQVAIKTIDLTDKNIFTSPFYRLQQNDVVFVEQNRRKIQQLEQQNIVQQIGIATGVITAIALILNFIR